MDALPLSEAHAAALAHMAQLRADAVQARRTSYAGGRGTAQRLPIDRRTVPAPGGARLAAQRIWAALGPARARTARPAIRAAGPVPCCS